MAPQLFPVFRESGRGPRALVYTVVYTLNVKPPKTGVRSVGYRVCVYTYNGGVA